MGAENGGKREIGEKKGVKKRRLFLMAEKSSYEKTKAQKASLEYTRGPPPKAKH